MDPKQDGDSFGCPNFQPSGDVLLENVEFYVVNIFYLLNSFYKKCLYVGAVEKRSTVVQS